MRNDFSDTNQYSTSEITNQFKHKQFEKIIQLLNKYFCIKYKLLSLFYGQAVSTQAKF